MFGSDWPVSLVACPYKKWIEVVERATKSLSGSERDQIFGGAAKEAYRL
jgi:L-fuconolactonase